MSISHIEFIVEEPSMEAALRGILPQIITPLTFNIYTHQCKEELIQSLPGRLNAYKKWLPRDWRIIVVVDRDNDVCSDLKARLNDIAKKAGIITRAVNKNQYELAFRLVIEELEAWYFGDWDAVVTAYPRVPTGIPRQQKYRDPDAIKGGTWESFERILQKAGYFRNGLRKIEAAGIIAPLIEPKKNKSRSFCVFQNLVEELAKSKV